MTDLDLVAVLRDAGLDPIDVRRAPARGAFDPIGQVVHHTANGGFDGRDTPSLELIRDTSPAAPLVQILWGYSGRPTVVTDGKANHAGKGSSAVLARLRADLAPVAWAKYAAPRQNDTDGNAWFIGHELENDGRGEPFPAVQVEAVAIGCAAIARAAGWSERTTIAHGEWTDRKPDPHGWDMPAFRARVGGLLLPAVHVPQEDDMPVTYCRDERYQNVFVEPFGGTVSAMPSGEVEVFRHDQRLASCVWRTWGCDLDSAIHRGLLVPA